MWCCVCYLPNMLDDHEADRHRETLKGLLGRGGTVLTLAVLARAGSRDGQRMPLSSLAPEMRAAVDQVRRVLETAPASDTLSAAIAHALSYEPAVALPTWLRPVLKDPGSLSRLGAAFEVSDLQTSLGPCRSAPSDREKGPAALAVALCRRQDTLSTLAARFASETDGALLSVMGRLAAVTASPGEPSTVCGTVRRILKGEGEWGA